MATILEHSRMFSNVLEYSRMFDKTVHRAWVPIFWENVCWRLERQHTNIWVNANADAPSVITHFSGFWGDILEQRRACYAEAPFRSMAWHGEAGRVTPPPLACDSPETGSCADRVTPRVTPKVVPCYVPCYARCYAPCYTVLRRVTPCYATFKNTQPLAATRNHSQPLAATPSRFYQLFGRFKTILRLNSEKIGRKVDFFDFVLGIARSFFWFKLLVTRHNLSFSTPRRVVWFLEHFDNFTFSAPFRSMPWHGGAPFQKWTL